MTSERTAALASTMNPEEWRHFLQLSTVRHRIGPIVAPRLAALANDGVAVPEAVCRQLDAHAQRNAMNALLQATATKKLTAAFAPLGVEPVILKGWPIADRYYGAIGARDSGDLDLLVPEAQLDDCIAAVQAIGYRLNEKSSRRSSILRSRVLREECKDLAFVPAELGPLLELHWRLYHFRGWPEPLDRPGGIIRHDTQAGEVVCPSDGANLVYLSVHGALHVWSRLKWLADIDRLARFKGPEALEADYEVACKLDARVPVALALRLAARVFGTPLFDELTNADSRLTRLEDRALDVIRRDGWEHQTTVNRIWGRVYPARVSRNLSQIGGVLRYDTLRRVRLGLAGLG